ncbi:MAG TPA: FecR domain-containing protein [Puia sp.]|uniref:FecR domain-containing protein n=1 Tax=Puia sp. TaxID=2045100 RepID=UPI002C276BDA|nr:FecR domain-containing protein [Puia sp.]HVU95470.1 FecR domain-containing protein [Puia sp.]
MEQYIDIDPIVTKYLREETLSPEEQAALDAWISQGEGRSRMLEDLRNDPTSIKEKLLQMEQMANNRIWDSIVSRVQQDGYWKDEPAVPTLPANAPAARNFGWRYLMAASVLLLIAAGAYWALNRTPAAAPAVTAQQTPAADVAPGGNRATLTLADGRKINLDSSVNGLLASQGNTRVTKLSDGQLAYNKTSEEKPQSPAFNVLSTPRAGQFSLALPDGSRVWLNNASSLRYPVAFTGATREVELSGEAYFEVAKDANHPFFVHTTGGPAGPATIEVLGTSFNIMAYNDESAERATLIDGSIRYIHGHNSALLKPEEQSVLDATGNLKTLSNVNVAEITAWKNGYFHFDHASLETTMRQIARWYDISVEYKGAIPPQQFVGKIQRNMPLSSLLKGLTGEHIHFTVEGRTVLVQP